MSAQEITVGRKPWKVGAIVLFVLNILDLITTYVALSRGASELNPISKFLIETTVFGLSIIVPLKLLIAGSAVWAAWGKQPLTVVSLCGVWFVTGIYALTIVLNSLHILWT